MPIYTARHHLVTKLLSKVKVSGKVQRFGNSPSGPTVCLTQIRVTSEGTPLLLDHVWISYDVSKDWRMGQRVAFLAEVVSYERCNNSTSYGFSRVTPLSSKKIRESLNTKNDPGSLHGGHTNKE